MSKEFPTNFDITIYGNINQVSPTISQGRVRIFYKYENRNGSYISDEFADELIKTLPYTPVKGIYDNFEEDYTDHGRERNLGRIYGIVPADPHFAWETHTDEDGVERTYACCDVYLFTALYEEATQIFSKPQSMELYSPSIKGDWIDMNGHEVFKFTEGCFLGLQVLGDDVEPCFEGAAFFSLFNQMKEMM